MRMRKIEVSVPNENYNFIKNITNTDDIALLEIKFKDAIEEFLLDSYYKYSDDINLILEQVREEFLKDNKIVYKSIDSNYTMKKIYENNINIKSDAGAEDFKEIVRANATKFFDIYEDEKAYDEDFPF